VYTKSGQHLASCRIKDARAVIDHKLYWAAADSVEEARYLTAILNCEALREAVAPLQARGQHNPRDFDMHVFALPFPSFNENDELHHRIADLAGAAEAVAAEVKLDPGWQFQKARRAVRDALQEHGVTSEIDGSVSELLAPAVEVMAAQAGDYDVEVGV
jgi:hypothetical protein